MSKEKSQVFSSGWLKGLSPNVIKLGMVSFFADIASEMLYPVVPIFLQVTLGAPLTAIGIIEGSAEMLASLLKIYSGRFTDRSKARKPWIFVGYLLSAGAKPLMALATGWGFVLACRWVDRTGKGLRTAPRDALLASSVSPQYRGRAFGWHRGMDTLGAAIGPLLALALLPLFKDNLRVLFVIALLPGLLSVLMVFLVEDEGQPADQLKIPLPPPVLSGFSPRFKQYLFTWGIFSLTNSSDAFLILRAKSQGVSLSTVILMYCFYNLVYALFSPYVGSPSDRQGRGTMLILGLLIFAGVYLGFGWASSHEVYWFLFAAYGLYMAMTDGIGKALAIDLAPAERKGEAIGLLATFTGISALVSSASAGLLWDYVNPAAPFYFGAVGALTSAGLLWFFRFQRPNPV